MHRLKSILKLARPKQWVKNIFVFAALVFSGQIVNLDSIVNALIAFAVFCIASSAVYFINDFKDIDKDKQHPVKKLRPLASGLLPPATGPIGFIALGIGSAVLSYFTLGLPSTIVVCTYLIINTAYSMGLKNLVIVDVLMISAGFVLRILAGAAAISVMPSTWLVLCAVTISLFLGFTKRRAEVVSLGDEAKHHRKVLAHYNVEFLDQMIAIVTAATVVCYILYTVDPHTVRMVGSRALLLSVPFVLYGVFRYLYLVYHTKSGGDPTRTVFTDVPLLITGGLWTIICTCVILFGTTALNFIRNT